MGGGTRRRNSSSGRKLFRGRWVCPGSRVWLAEPRNTWLNGASLDQRREIGGGLRRAFFRGVNRRNWGGSHRLVGMLLRDHLVVCGATLTLFSQSGSELPLPGLPAAAGGGSLFSSRSSTLRPQSPRASFPPARTSPSRLDAPRPALRRTFLAARQRPAWHRRGLRCGFFSALGSAYSLPILLS